jgi:hypothetical protein
MTNAQITLRPAQVKLDLSMQRSVWLRFKKQRATKKKFKKGWKITFCYKQ